MKCYFGGARSPSEFPFLAACFAPDIKEAKRLIWNSGEVAEDCDHEYFEMRVVRSKEHDNLFGRDGRTDAHVIQDAAVLRDMGWMCYCDEHCACCGRATMDGEFPVCEECDSCSE
ncbi:hypothetical protein [Marinobacter sp. CA1]|uniref:hypothetical protein n=1 Tax=Marinobacter sp. CA1 TaxID=2817656 RepID=UPI001D093F32|nr:hypothetical protein [Marinobacter sp. CA1]UDL04021.1 hypothetical protein J2887_15035 [Marinobacter sp. CA1]